MDTTKTNTLQIVANLLMIGLLLFVCYTQYTNGSNADYQRELASYRAKNDSLLVMLKNTTSNIEHKLDSIKVIERNNTIIKTNFIQDTSYANKIKNVDSLYQFIRIQLSKLGTAKFD